MTIMLRRKIVKLTMGQERTPATAMHLKQKLAEFGIELEDKTGHLFYHEDFVPIKIDFALVFVRHGETYGNCGQSTSVGEIDKSKVKYGIKNFDQRVYQGDVDTAINQLTDYGKQQALEVALRLHQHFLQKHWVPDIVFCSPLNRAKETALPFVKQYYFEDKFIILEDIKEMSFGSWDNRRVCDLQDDDLCHLFYREQNALVKSDGMNSIGQTIKAENFCEVLLRAHRVLTHLNKVYPRKKVLMFSHSMFGAACTILLGKGQRFEKETFLAFDGKRGNGTYYTLPNAVPVMLTGDVPNQLKRSYPFLVPPT